ncbi:hypothetical protein [Streptomyces sp. NPDC015125]|uniref:hypothetical protein n=1 Tax=Streptomyces sp. NPDC015125 TaxID=3364938 RepID=UPI0036FA2D73
MQHDPKDPNFDDEALEPDGWVWVRGVDYVAGWRSAADAATELTGAMDGVGIDTAKVMSPASTASDGSGVLRLSLPVEAALALANAAREEALRWRKAGA